MKKQLPIPILIGAVVTALACGPKADTAVPDETTPPVEETVVEPDLDEADAPDAEPAEADEADEADAEAAETADAE